MWRKKAVQHFHTHTGTNTNIDTDTDTDAARPHTHIQSAKSTPIQAATLPACDSTQLCFVSAVQNESVTALSHALRHRGTVALLCSAHWPGKKLVAVEFQLVALPGFFASWQLFDTQAAPFGLPTHSLSAAPFRPAPSVRPEQSKKPLGAHHPGKHGPLPSSIHDLQLIAEGPLQLECAQPIHEQELEDLDPLNARCIAELAQHLHILFFSRAVGMPA